MPSASPPSVASFLPLSGVIAGQLQIQGRTNHSGITIQVAGLSTTTEADGRFSLAGVPAGSQFVEASLHGYLGVRATMCPVLAGETTTLSPVSLLGGDLNQDATINIFDLVALGAAFSQCPPPDPLMDYIPDGCINIFDLVILGANYSLSGPLVWTAATWSTPTPTMSPVSTATPTATPTVTATEVPADRALVARVVDGDTVELANGRRLRYVGMDTPELYSGPECYAVEATQRNRELVEGRWVRLEKDVRETDRYDRLLRYVWVDLGRGEFMVNGQLLLEGHAQVATYPPDVRYVDWFLELQRQAREAGRGLWSACVAPTATPTSSDALGLHQRRAGRRAHRGAALRGVPDRARAQFGAARLSELP